jgi:hypothetical protein
MKRLLALGGLVLGLLLVGYAVFARETDEEKIHKLLGRLERAVRVDSDTATNPLIRAGQLRKEFSDLFDENVSYRIPELTTPSTGSESLVALAVRSSVSLTTLDVAFSRVDIQIIPPGMSAVANTTAKVRAFRGSETYEESDRRVRFEFSKASGDWRVASVSVSSPQD